MLPLPSPLVAKKKKCQLRLQPLHPHRPLRLSRKLLPLLPLLSLTLLPLLPVLWLAPQLTPPLALLLPSPTLSRSLELALQRAAS